MFVPDYEADRYLLGSYRIATAPEPNSNRLTSLKSTCFERSIATGSLAGAGRHGAQESMAGWGLPILLAQAMGIMGVPTRSLL